MKRKWLLGVAIALVVLLLITGIVISLSLGKIVRIAIQTVGPRITQVSVTVDAVDLSLLTGSAKVKGLVVGNPKGFSAPQAITVGAAAVRVNPSSVFSDKIVIPSVHVEAPEITFEGNPFGKNNLNTILKNVNNSTKSGGPAATNTTVNATGKPAKKLEVDDFLITGAKVNFNGTMLSLPPVHLTDLGKGNDGITAADLTRRTLDALTTATLKTVTGTVSDLGKSAGKTGKDLEESLQNSASGLGKSLGGLFKHSTN